MGMKNANVTAVAGWVPPDILTNADLEKMVDTSDEWIRTRTGIQERRILKDPNKAASDLGYEAVKILLEKRGIGIDEIDLLICGTVTGDYVFPDTANAILNKLGAKRPFGYDINAACSGFIYSFTTASQFIRSGMYEKVIVVGVDVMSRIIDYEDRTTCVLFGDGAGAVLLEASEEEYGFVDAVLRSDGAGAKHLHMKAGGSLLPPSHETVENRLHYVYQEGRPVFKAAIKGMGNSISELLKKNNLEKSDIAWVVPHQANLRIIEGVASILDFPMEKVMVNIHKYGNTTSGTIPLCLRDYESQLKKDDLIILTAFGGGYTWGSILVRWSYDG